MKKNELLYITDNLQIQKSTIRSYYLNGAGQTHAMGFGCKYFLSYAADNQSV